MDGGAQPKPSDADTADAGTPSEAPPPQPAAEKEKTEDITWTLFDEGRFIRYDISGKIFELTSKYKPPIKKIPNAFADKITAKRTLREIKLLLNLHHENVVGVKDNTTTAMGFQ